MTNTKKLRKFFGYSQEQLAKLLGVSRSTVAMWENSSQEPDYETICKISMIFSVSSDIVMGSGIFKKWDQIIEYYDAVSFKLNQLIPGSLEMPTFSEDKFLTAWLDTRLYFEPDELQLARWFSFAVKEINIIPVEDTPDGEKDADVEIVFTPEFEALIQAENKRETERIEQEKSINEKYRKARIGEEEKACPLNRGRLDARLADLINRIPDDRIPEVERYLRFQAEQEEKP